MPLYEYACTDCGHRFEILQRIGQTADGLKCPECDAERLEKQFSTFASSSDGKATALRAAGCGGGSGFT
ncbi:MAG: zinc ribbon domain-containing protein [Thermoanaerobaculia bacterium]